MPLMKLCLLIILLLISACAENVPPGELEHMRGQIPNVQDPPVSYNSNSIGVP